MIYSFNVKYVPKLSEIGGKAKALIETTSAELPVPEGIVLSVSFFDEWLKEIKSSDEWNILLKNTTKEACDYVKVKSANLKFSTAMRKEFDSKLKELKGEVFAVRSSSPEEDLEGTSFAGMYDTYLGITKTQLEGFVAKAFSSCFDFRVMEYKKQNGISLDRTSIAVIIQKQIASDVSGVGFSLNPLNNCYDEVVINASFGLGEAIVSGIVTPDTYVVDSVKNKIIEKQVNEKKIAIHLNRDGGTQEKQNLNAKEQALSDKQILELSSLIKKCEEHYDKPMDTEWAYENGKLYLLQSRPITTYVPLYDELMTKPGERKDIYVDLMGLTQGFSDNMSVLGMDVFSRMFDIKTGGIMTIDLDGSAPAIYGRQYINVPRLFASLGKTAGNGMLINHDKGLGKIFKNIDIKEYELKKKPESLKGMKKAMLKVSLGMLPAILKARKSDPKDLIENYLKTCDELIIKVNNLNSNMTLQEMFDIIIGDLNSIFKEVGFMVAGMFAVNKINKLFKGSGLEDLVTAMSMDLDGNPTSEMGHMLFDLASSSDFKAIKSEQEFLDKVENRGFSDEFLKKFDAFVEKYGCRGFKEIDIASERLYENYSILYEKLININVDDSRILDVKERRQIAYDKLHSYAKTKGKGFEKKFVKTARTLQSSLGYREHPKYIIVRIFSKFRDLILEVGERFVKEGRLDDKKHIFDLMMDDVTRVQKGEDIDIRVLREKYMAQVGKLKDVKDFPLVIDSRGKIFRPILELKDGDLQGSPIASGKVTGRAKVLRLPYEKPLLPGEILVVATTEPSWTPIFINAAGVVMEVGGPLQHGGIIAREYGIPCVSGLIGVMDIIKDGDLLEVDGSNGVVRLVEKAE
ncbi:Phosphoenolpyruvate synthase [Candidatus Izimaplasma bacterium HR1]|uniref:PEP/pyruvate-binding domain-containing protein n=1 Tax=Candidatus Izimoplasma sp. HR1 TaxID=1541959 RepID=UPI0004F673D8|nr:Phosphoenolpyruvate synthase [Candidatus Izimaplasma bacterium HR1]